jgi:ElaB/YqjD/DUF883 family membrane-anchored ribosome-binding protein
MTMANDPTTPAGGGDMPQTGRTARGRPAGRVGYPETMGDEQNPNPVGDPSARTGEGEVGRAFAAQSVNEPRTFLENDEAQQMADKAKDEAQQMAGKAKDAAAETLSTLTERVNALRDQVQHSAEAARDWAKRRADSTADAAKRLQAERPVVVLSVSAGAALVVGLLAGFVIGRATADD